MPDGSFVFGEKMVAGDRAGVACRGDDGRPHRVWTDWM